MQAAIAALITAFGQRPDLVVWRAAMNEYRNGRCKLTHLNAADNRPPMACVHTRSLTMNADQVMTRRVVSIAPEASIWEAACLMLEKQISGLPVIDGDGNLVGILTEADALRRAETGTEHRRPRWLELLTTSGQLADEYIHSHSRKVAEVMTRDVVTVAESTSLEQIVRLMETRRIKRVPVMRGREVVGIVSRANILHALASSTDRL
jgi:CBS domain-containing protein